MAQTIARLSTNARAIRKMFESASLGGPEKAVGFMLWRVVHRYVREIDRALLSLDLTHLQFTTLAMAAWLGRSGIPATQADIARFAEIAPMQISHMLKTLESKAMVSRLQNKFDGRTKQIDVTAEGLTALKAALPIVIEVQRRLFGDKELAGGVLVSELLRIAASDES